MRFRGVFSLQETKEPTTEARRHGEIACRIAQECLQINAEGRRSAFVCVYQLP